MLTTKEMSHLEIMGKSQSMAEAAAKAAVSTSAMSQSLSSSEAKLKTQLFIRSRGMLSPTHSGEVVLRRVESLMNQMSALHIELNDLVVSERKSLRFGIGPAVADLLLKEVLADICDEDTEVLPRFEVAFWDQLESRLLNREIDVFVGGFPREPKDDRFAFHPLYKDRLVAVARNDHPLRDSEVVRLEALVRYPILAYSSKLDSTWQSLVSDFDLELFRRNVPASVMPDPMKYLDLLVRTNHVLVCPELNWLKQAREYTELSAFRVEPLRGTTHMMLVTLAGIENMSSLDLLQNSFTQQLGYLRHELAG